MPRTYQQILAVMKTSFQMRKPSKVRAVKTVPKITGGKYANLFWCDPGDHAFY